MSTMLAADKRHTDLYVEVEEGRLVLSCIATATATTFNVQTHTIRLYLVAR